MSLYISITALITHNNNLNPMAMDWFSWLSKTSLDPSLVYEYGLVFGRNELQKEDLSYFDHEFLQSMGVSVAKHRLEILKLAKKEVGGGIRANKSLLRFIFAITRTQKNLSKYFNKLVSHHEVNQSEKTLCLPEPKSHCHHKSSEKEFSFEKPILKARRIAKSGPLDGKAMQEKLMITNRSLKLSGPLDRSMQERLVLSYRSPVSSGPLDGRMYLNKSPILSGPLDRRPPSPRVYRDCSSKKENFGGGGGGGYDYDDQTLWSALFQDLKPT